MIVVAFNGSPRECGNTHCIIEEAAKALCSHGIEVEKIQVDGYALRGSDVGFCCKKKKDGRCAIGSDPVNG